MITDCSEVERAFTSAVPAFLGERREYRTKWLFLVEILKFV